MSNKIIAGTASGATALPVASTIDAVNDYFAVYTASATATQAINRNTALGISSGPVGLTDVQTLTNKTLTTPTISGPVLSGTISGTYVIGGTPTFPSSIATLTGTQTLTNKTLTSPTINAPTITNATLSADTITGFSTSNSGTIYGIAVATGVITTSSSVNGSALVAASVGSTALATNAVQASQIGTGAILLGYTQITSTITTSATTVTQATGLTQAVTIPSGSRKTKITIQLPEVDSSTASTKRVYLSIWDGVVGSGTQLTTGIQVVYGTGGVGNSMTLIAVVSPSAGAKTYNVGWFTDSSNTASIICSSTSPAFILVEDL